MAHLQLQINNGLLKQAKKNAIDQEVSLKAYVEKAIIVQVIADEQKVIAEKQELNNNLTKEKEI